MSFVRILYYAILISLFFPMLIIFIIPNTSAFLHISLIGLFVLLSLVIGFNYKKMINYVNSLFKIPIFCYYAFFIVFCIINALLHLVSGYYQAPFYYYFWRVKDLIWVTMLVYLLPVFGIILKISPKTITKIIYTMTCIIIYIGIVQYIAFLWDNTILINIIECLAPGRVYREDVMDCRNLMRVYSIFDEPAMLAQFIFLFFPIMFNLALSKVNIFKNQFINNFVKFTILPAMLIVLVFTKSPIFLVLCSIETAVLLIWKYKKNIKKYFVYIFGIFWALIFITGFLISNLQNQIASTYLMRIIKFFSYITDLSSFILVEQSLGTRILSYIINFNIFLQHFWLGVGILNSEVFASKILTTLSYPITFELVKKFWNNQYAISLNHSVCYTTLADNGIIGFIFFIYFYYKTYKILLRLTKKQSGIIKVFCIGLSQSFIVMFINFFYNLSITNITLWLFLGLVLMLVYNCRRIPN